MTGLDVTGAALLAKEMLDAGESLQANRYFEAPGLLVDVASAEYLLAMKLLASRVETDADDIALLYSL